MSFSIIKLPQAKLDLIEIADFISEDSLSAAFRFLDAAEQGFALLATSPAIGWACRFANPELHDLRVWRIKGFERYLIFYRSTLLGVEIVRVLHGARDLDDLFE